MQSYSNIARFFHWLIAGLIVSQYVLAKLAERAKHSDQTLEQLALLANHKSIGITILALAVVRLVYRLFNKAPRLPASMPAWQQRVSHLSHGFLYGFLFAMPISGWLMSSAKSYSVSWFNLVALPDFIAPSEPLSETLHVIHHYLGEALFVLALVHIVAALKHHFVDKDDVLKRMGGLGGYLLFIATAGVAIATFGRLFDASSTPEPATIGVASGTASEQSIQVIASSELPLWNIDYGESYIKFTGDQAGAPFTGEWKSWQADIQFDAAQLDLSRFNVTIDAQSGFSNDQERDETIRSPEFFDVAQFKEAKYLSQKFVVADEQVESHGQLLMKGGSSAVVLSFTVDQEGGQKVLNGRATIDRLLWNIGTGDWTDTSWVGKNVLVEVRVVAKP